MSLTEVAFKRLALYVWFNVIVYFEKVRIYHIDCVHLLFELIMYECVGVIYHSYHLSIYLNNVDPRGEGWGMEKGKGSCGICSEKRGELLRSWNY